MMKTCHETDEMVKKIGRLKIEKNRKRESSKNVKNSYYTISYKDTLCIKDLDNFNMLWWFDFRLEPIFTTAPATPTNVAHFESGQR